MPTSSRESSLCTYRYDPLDRLADSTRLEQAATQRYHCDKRLVTEIEGTVHRSIVQHGDYLLAQQQREGADVSSALLATDRQRSVLNALDANQPNPLAYSPYGHRPRENGLLSLLGFNGERPDSVTGCYHLGNGYRQFNPVLMRFNSPDSWSPFRDGGVNAYAYCGGDPINRVDPNGHRFFTFGIALPDLPDLLTLSKLDIATPMFSKAAPVLKNTPSIPAPSINTLVSPDKSPSLNKSTQTAGTSHTISSPANLTPSNKTPALQDSDMINLRNYTKLDITKKISTLNRDIKYHKALEAEYSKNMPWSTEKDRIHHHNQAYELTKIKENLNVTLKQIRT